MDSDAKSERYARQVSLKEIGEAGQERLLSSHVALIGVGGLGSPAALYLSAAGIGHLTIIDADRVSLSNLQRQVLFSTEDIGNPKVDVARKRLMAANPDSEVIAIDDRISEDNAGDLLRDHDFVIDATDNFDAKFLIADTCHVLKVPYSHAGIDKFFGQTLTVLPGDSTCYRCIFNEAPRDNPGPPQGPLGAVPGVIGTIQANEAIKHIAGIGNLLTNRLFTYNALDAAVRIIPVQPNVECKLCGSKTE
jgi:molybdopterin/thiamine biosynthesis adenylyltransferase